MEKRKYFGKTFWRKKDGYWVNNMPIHAQRWVWINHFGAIPEGMDIHHKDGDKGNNEIANLEMLNRSEHLKRHWAQGRFDLEKRRIQLAEARKWLQTPKGKRKQRKNALADWAKRESFTISCMNCGKEVQAFFKRAKYCSDPCRYQYIRNTGPNPIKSPRKRLPKVCIRCGISFKAAMPYALYCSTRCRKRQKK